MKKIKTLHFILPFTLVITLFSCTSRMAGRFDMRQGDYPSAVQNYQKVVSENPDDWQAREQLGIAYYKSGQIPEAVSALKAALQQNPDAADARYYLGLAQLKADRRDEAIQNWEEYANPDAPIVQGEVKKQLTLLKINDSLQFAKEALDQEASLQTQPPEPNSVAVFYFKDLSPDNQFKYLQKALASMIITDLSRVESLNVIERLKVQYLLEEMELGSTGIVDQSTAPRTGRMLGAEHLVVGILDSGSIVNQTGVASTQKKDVIASFNFREDQENFFVLQKEIVNKILQVLNARVKPSEKRKISRYHTTNRKAANFYGQGLDARDQGKWKEANVFFRKALKEDPNFFLAFWQSDNTPGESAPSLDQLGQMSPSEIADSADNAVRAARGQQRSAAARNQQQSEQKSTGDQSESREPQEG
ncbi:MAG: tetratricopeptide repeat protein, partial [Thermodesulfobacteriota bacterium]